MFSNERLKMTSGNSSSVGSSPSLTRSASAVCEESYRQGFLKEGRVLNYLNKSKSFIKSKVASEVMATVSSAAR